MSHSKFHSAGQAEILRASQKDEIYVSQLHDILSQLTLLGGRKLWVKYAAYHVVISRLLYYMCTNARWLQTLGEEYTGIIPVENRSNDLLSFKKMLFYVILLSGGSMIFNTLISKLKKINSSSENSNQEPKRGLMKFLQVFENSIPYLDKINKIIFYFNGGYYSMVNRLTGVKHVLVRSWMRDKQSHYGFKILAILSLINLILSLLMDFSNWCKVDEDVDTYTRNGALARNSCKLCLNPRKNTSITPCGHLFCWKCIMEWLRVRKDCPLCKSPVIPCRVVFLQNYDEFRE